MTRESDALRIHGGVPLRGAVHLGQDPHVLECVLALAALADGRSVLQGVSACDQVTAALAAWSALGVRSGLDGETLWIEGVGLRGLRAPTGALDSARSSRLLAQLAAVISAQAFGTRVTCSARPHVDQLVGVLRARGAQIAATGSEGEGLYPPLAIAPLLASERLSPIDASLPLADPCTKDALLLSGLYAGGPTTLSEPQVSPDHMERLFVALGLPLRRIGSVVALDIGAWDGRVPVLGVRKRNSGRELDGFEQRHALPSPHASVTRARLYRPDATDESRAQAFRLDDSKSPHRRSAGGTSRGSPCRSATSRRGP